MAWGLHIIVFEKERKTNMKSNKRIKSNLAMFLLTMGACTAGRAQESPATQPEVRITNPGNGVVLEGPRDLSIYAEVDNIGQTGVSMEFTGDGSIQGTVDEPLNLIPPQLLTPEYPIGPFRFVWENVRGGQHTIQAKAWDDLGNESVSKRVEFTVMESIPANIVTISATDPEASEPEEGNPWIDTAEFTLRRTGSIDHDLDVYFRSEGIAETGVDYLPLSNVVTIPAGERSIVILLQPLDDSDPEGDEGVLIILEPSPYTDVFPMPSNSYQIGRLSVAEAVIRDGENPIPNLAPRVEILFPLPGESFLAPAKVWLTALAQDADGEIERVEFYEGKELIEEGHFEHPDLYQQYWQSIPGLSI